VKEKNTHPMKLSMFGKASLSAQPQNTKISQHPQENSFKVETMTRKPQFHLVGASLGTPLPAHNSFFAPGFICRISD
jgi:hypothetical protein